MRTTEVQDRIVRAVLLLSLGFMGIGIVETVAAVSPALGQPIPQQEQESRMIQAVEQLSRDLNAHKFAVEANTRALEALNRQSQSRAMMPPPVAPMPGSAGPTRPW